MAMYVLVLAIFLGGFGLIYRVVHPPFGQVLTAIRENEPRAIRWATTPTSSGTAPRAVGGAGRAGRATKAIVFQLVC